MENGKLCKHQRGSLDNVEAESTSYNNNNNNNNNDDNDNNKEKRKKARTSQLEKWGMARANEVSDGTR